MMNCAANCSQHLKIVRDAGRVQSRCLASVDSNPNESEARQSADAEKFTFRLGFRPREASESDSRQIQRWKVASPATLDREEPRAASRLDAVSARDESRLSLVADCVTNI